jgi:Fe-S-cluster containining protein
MPRAQTSLPPNPFRELRTMPQPAPLTALHDEIDHRVTTIRSTHPDWPCAKGCGGCCQRLADVPQLTATEWALLREGLAALPPAQLDRIETALAALGPQPPKPVTCPLLDPETQACLVYAQRPVACRTYGFYSERVLGLYCTDIETRVADGSLADVVWGNHEAIEYRLQTLGERRPLTAWFTPMQAER